jgi:hypothetical protein
MVELYTSDACSICKQVLQALGGAENAPRLGVKICNMSTDAYANSAGRALGIRSMPGLAEDGVLTAQAGNVIPRLRQLQLIR